MTTTPNLPETARDALERDVRRLVADWVRGDSVATVASLMRLRASLGTLDEERRKAKETTDGG